MIRKLAKKEIEEKLKEKHICLRMFDDDSILITDEKNNAILPKEPKPLVGPLNTYHQAVWYSMSPVCVIFGGREY